MTTIFVTLPVPKDQIPHEVARLEAKLYELGEEQKLLRRLLKSVQDCCDHKGQKTGYDPREGNWGNPCPTCRWSY